MIPRYTHPEMGAIWSEQRRYETWLEVELAATDALADAGVVPADDARALRERAAFDIARIEEIEQTTQHDVIAFTTAVAERVGPAARWLHFGLTSSDVLDTALALQMRQACDLILTDVDALRGGGRAPGDGASAHADDRPHARRPRRADDVRREAGAVVRGAAARSRARDAARARPCRSASCRAPSACSRISIRRSKRRCAARLGLAAGAGVVAGDSARSPRRADDGAGDSRRVAREVRARDPRPAEDGDRRSRGAVRRGPEGLVGDAAQAQSDRLRAGRRAWRG